MKCLGCVLVSAFALSACATTGDPTTTVTPSVTASVTTHAEPALPVGDDVAACRTYIDDTMQQSLDIETALLDDPAHATVDFTLLITTADSLREMLDQSTDKMDLYAEPYAEHILHIEDVFAGNADPNFTLDVQGLIDDMTALSTYCTAVLPVVSPSPS